MSCFEEVVRFNWPGISPKHGKGSGAAGDKVILLTENQSAYVPLGSIHRLENPGRLPMVLIEVQTGSYFGEDDIIRYEDVYART